LCSFSISSGRAIYACNRKLGADANAKKGTLRLIFSMKEGHNLDRAKTRLKTSKRSLSTGKV
jgi:hypothetical protein